MGNRSHKNCGKCAQAPLARQGHTTVWHAASDSLLVFGGEAGQKNLNDLHSICLVTSEWAEAACSGDVPPARHSHAACMLDEDWMVLFGGCGAQGTLYNDFHALHVPTFRSCSAVCC